MKNKFAIDGTRSTRTGMRCILLLVLVIGSITGCGSLNRKAEETIEGAGTELGVPVAVEDVSIRIFRGSGQITGFDVGNPAGYQAEHAFDMDLIRVNLNLLSIFSRPLTLDELIIDSPVVNLELKGRGASNFKEISDRMMASSRKPDESKSIEEPEIGEPDKKEENAAKRKPTRLKIRKLRIEGVTFNLRRADGTIASGTLPTIDLEDVGGDEGATVGGIAAVIAIAMAGGILDQLTEERIASGEFDAEAMREKLARRLAMVAAELPDDLRHELENKANELKLALDSAATDGYANLDSMARDLREMTAAIVAGLSAALSDTQQQKINAFLGEIDKSAVAAVREAIVDRLETRLLLSEEQRKSVRPILDDTLERLSRMLEGADREAGGYEEFKIAYLELREEAARRLGEILDGSQMEGLRQWTSHIDQRIRAQYFAE